MSKVKGEAITHAEWLAALTEAQRDVVDDHPTALTVLQLADEWGLSERAARRKAAILLEKGILTRVTKRLRNSGGSTYTVAAYLLKR